MIAQIVGRLRPGVGIEQASREMEHVGARLARAFPEDNEGLGVFVEPLRRALNFAYEPLQPRQIVALAVSPATTDC